MTYGVVTKNDQSSKTHSMRTVSGAGLHYDNGHKFKSTPKWINFFICSCVVSIFVPTRLTKQPNPKKVAIMVYPNPISRDYPTSTSNDHF